MRHRIEYAAVILIRTLVRFLPRPATLRLGAALGGLFYLLDRRRRELAIDNLRASFPAKTRDDSQAILRSTYSHFGRHVVEVLNFDAMSPDQMRRHIEVEGSEHVQRAMARGKGVMFCSGHFGSWELHIMAHALWFQPLVVVARTLDNPLLDRLVEDLRARLGTQAIPRQGAVRGLLKTLLANQPVAIMIDQHMHGRSAVVVDFFHRPAATTSAVAAIALRTGAALIPVFALPLPGGRYRMVYETQVDPPAGDDPDPVRTYTQRCTNVLERYIRRYPELWLWMHRRWRVEETTTADTASVPLPRDAEARRDVLQ